MTELALADPRSDLLSALRRLGGTATLGDVVAATGLPADVVSGGLKGLLATHRGHLAVTDEGELLYRFDPRLIQRYSEPWTLRFRRAAWTLFTRAFKAWIVLMLVVYFVVFVALVVAALVAGQKGGDRRGGDIFRGSRRRGSGLGDLAFWYWIWGPRWRLGRPYYGHRWERTLPRDDRVPFYKKVFAFVFGPDEPRITQAQRDRSTLRLIRARKGILSTADLVEHTGLRREEAEEEMARLVGAYGGEPVVSPQGGLSFAFPDLMLSAEGAVRVREPNPAWLRLEYPKELTGNTAAANALVAGINGFNLLAAATAPWFIFPRLGLGGPLAFVFLVVVPVVFSLAFFAVPGLRMMGVRRENERRRRRNVRRLVLAEVYRDALGPDTGVDAESVHAVVAARLPDATVRLPEVAAVLESLAAEFDAEITEDPTGRLRYRFAAIQEEMAEAEAMRRTLRLDQRTLGPVVFDTGDTDAEAGQRELQAFDRTLAEASPEEFRGAVEESRAALPAYVPSPDRVGFEAEYELAAFEEELHRRGLERRA